MPRLLFLLVAVLSLISLHTSAQIREIAAPDAVAFHAKNKTFFVFSGDQVFIKPMKQKNLLACPGLSARYSRAIP